MLDQVDYEFRAVLVEDLASQVCTDCTRHLVANLTAGLVKDPRGHLLGVGIRCEQLQVLENYRNNPLSVVRTHSFH